MRSRGLLRPSRYFPTSHDLGMDAEPAPPYTLTITPLSSPADGVYFNVPGVAIVKWDSPSMATHIEWQGWANSTEFRGANDALIRVITNHRTSRILGDSRGIKAIRQPDQDWVNDDWFPRILAAGLRRMAMV